MSTEEDRTPLHQVQETIDSLVEEKKLDEGSLLALSNSLKRAHEGCSKMMAKKEKSLRKEVVDFGRESHRQVKMLHQVSSAHVELLAVCNTMDDMWKKVSHKEDSPKPGFAKFVRVDIPADVHHIMTSFFETTNKSFKCGKVHAIRDACAASLSLMHEIPSDEEEEPAETAEGDAADGAAAEA